MSKLNKYQQQLTSAIQTTRADLLSDLKKAQAMRMTALSTRDLAAHDKWFAYKEMGRSEQILAVSSRLEEMAARARLITGNLTLFAHDSQTDSEETQAAMAEAAAAIKNAASAMELLTEAVHADAAVTNARNQGDLVNDDAIAASKAVGEAMKEVNSLQTLSLNCSIIATTPLAGSVAQSFSLLGDQAESLMTDITQARDAARQEVTARATLRNQTWKSFYKTIEPFEQPLKVKKGLTESFVEIDKLANFGLTVLPSNEPAEKSDSNGPTDQQNLVAGLLAKVVLPVETAQYYNDPVFYAVKELDAAKFNFHTSNKENPAEKLATSGIYQAQLRQDNTGAPLSFGTSYCIFMKQELKAGTVASRLTQLPRFSMPSQPILANYSVQNLLQPTILRLQCGKSPGPADPLLVAFTLPSPPPKGVNYRMVVIPSHLWRTEQDDETYLIERANPSDSVELDFTLLSTPPPTKTPPTTTQHRSRQESIFDQFQEDIKTLLPSEDHTSALEKAKAQVTDLLTKKLSQKDLKKTALVYYSSVLSKAKYEYVKFGYYSDMSGDIIALEQDSYKVGVLAWQSNQAGPDVCSLIGRSKSIGTPPPYFEGSGPAEDLPSAPTSPTKAK